MTEISKLLGPYVQLIDCRPHLVRSVLLPHSALPWLIQTLAATVHLQSIVKPKWCNRSENLSFRASVLSNAKGRFIRIVEELPVGRIASICIPEVLAALAGRPSINISLYAGKMNPSPLLGRTHKFYQQNTLSLRPHPTAKSSFPQPSTFSPNIIASHHCKPKPWNNPRDSILLFANNRLNPTQNPFERSPMANAIICDWPNYRIIDLGFMARDISRAASLPFTPTLRPFGAGRALFFCKTS